MWSTCRWESSCPASAERSRRGAAGRHSRCTEGSVRRRNCTGPAGPNTTEGVTHGRVHGASSARRVRLGWSRGHQARLSAQRAPPSPRSGWLSRGFSASPGGPTVCDRVGPDRCCDAGSFRILVDGELAARTAGRRPSSWPPGASSNQAGRSGGASSPCDVRRRPRSGAGRSLIDQGWENVDPGRIPLARRCRLASARHAIDGDRCSSNLAMAAEQTGWSS